MNAHQTGVRLYLFNFALLFTHEIDAGFWKEWDLFHLPGGIQLFLVINFALLLAALYGLLQFVQGNRRGYIFALVLAASGVLAFFIHACFILGGHPEFRLPVSLGILGSTLVVSIGQAVNAGHVLKTGKRESAASAG